MREQTCPSMDPVPQEKSSPLSDNANDTEEPSATFIKKGNWNSIKSNEIKIKNKWNKNKNKK